MWRICSRNHLYLYGTYYHWHLPGARRFRTGKLYWNTVSPGDFQLPFASLVLWAIYRSAGLPNLFVLLLTGHALAAKLIDASCGEDAWSTAPSGS